MRLRIQRAIVVAITAAALGGLTSGSWADTLRRLVDEGNRLLAEEKYDDALEKYRTAQVESPESPYLYFNIANALQRQGKNDEAIETYRKVYTREQPSLGAWALYNIGVGQYRQAEQKIGTQEYQEALKLLEECMNSNQQAMRIDPADEDPKFNYEQAKRKWKEVLDALKKQQEEQQKKQQEEQPQNQQPQPKQDQQNQQPNEEQQQNEQPQQQERQNEDQGTSETAQAQGEPQPLGEMSPEEAERLLNSLPEQNAEDMRRFLLQGRPRGYSPDKDW